MSISVLLLCLAACGSRNGTQDVPEDAISSRSGYPALELLLEQEFLRLGIEPEKLAAEVADGKENAVFDLSAALIDPDGEGPLPAEGLALSWTERAIGDYNADGEVNISDLTPLGANFHDAVQYREGEAVPHFPFGDPEGAGLENWQLAAIDGDANGQLNISDLTPLAQHFMQRIVGYRVYRKGPGDSQFALLENPLSPVLPYSIARPTPASAPVRYHFADEPPIAGEYAYRVVAYHEGEAEVQSNTATIAVEFGFADTEAPVWDTTTGIQTAAANPDGTVTLSWGSATDAAPVGVQPNPPVTYSVYYSTQTPIDFEVAARIEALTALEWTSSQLVNGQNYFFAVRARDSYSTPNEDDNTVELSATISGGVVDTEAPVWTDYGYSGGDEVKDYLMEGISEILVRDGSLTIKRGGAMDELSPPVYFDLYYYSDRQFREDFDGSAPTSEQVMEFGEKVEDIPPVYELEWENRHKVWLFVTARDSAEPANTAQPMFPRRMAPSDLMAVEVDIDFPSLTKENINHHELNYCFDPFEHRLYMVYAERLEDYGPPARLHCIAWDCDTGEWEYEPMGLGPPDTKVSFFTPRLSPLHEVWVISIENIAPFLGYYNFHRRRTNGQWEHWVHEHSEQTWDGQFDHNGYPTYPLLEDSDVFPGERFKAVYRYFDPQDGNYHEETIADPGAAFETHLRPDGSMAVMMFADAVPFQGDPVNPSRTQARVFERSAAGAWSLELQLETDVREQNGFQPDFWDAEWYWAYGLDVEDDGKYVLLEDSSGIRLEGPFPAPESGGGSIVEKAGPASIHMLTGQEIWNGSGYVDYDFNGVGFSNLSYREDLIITKTVYSRADGFLFSLQPHPAPDGSGWRQYAYIMPPDSSIYDLNP